ncbi:hypothetical protein AGR4A_pAt10175 [Agrobacterium tumefaciens str. B6]|uniref:Uncharacterized protein n=1 Tax=Agrobacterium tumefaciens str. B6 TaxID=1183423 RepID=A0A822VAB1_AGRTU|nr:hypothetical protein AGR4A_pAt10175 [Agrobacterium tumefaciens str. B6]
MVVLSERLTIAQRGAPSSYETIPGLAVTALCYVEAICAALKREGADDGKFGELGGRSDRFPISLQHRRLLSLAEATVETLWRELIETWVIAQHVNGQRRATVMAPSACGLRSATTVGSGSTSA